MSIFQLFQKSIIEFSSSEYSSTMLRKPEYHLDFESSENVQTFQKLEFRQSQTLHLFDFIKSLNEINQYNQSYLRVSWWTTTLSDTKRITNKNPKIRFSIAG